MPGWADRVATPRKSRRRSPATAVRRERTGGHGPEVVSADPRRLLRVLPNLCAQPRRRRSLPSGARPRTSFASRTAPTPTRAGRRDQARQWLCRGRSDGNSGPSAAVQQSASGTPDAIAVRGERQLSAAARRGARERQANPQLRIRAHAPSSSGPIPTSELRPTPVGSAALPPVPLQPCTNNATATPVQTLPRHVDAARPPFQRPRHGSMLARTDSRSSARPRRQRHVSETPLPWPRHSGVRSRGWKRQGT